MTQPARRFALGMGAINVVMLIAIAAVSAKDGFWDVGAEALPSHAKPVSEIARVLERQGYERIYAVEFEEGQYRVKVLDPEGRRLRLSLDPMTGAVVSERP